MGRIREILFKGVVKATGEWVEGDFYRVDILGFIIPRNSSGIYSRGKDILKEIYPCYECVPETIGQFTGEYDVNANKIFEHDIVKKVVNGNVLIGVVEYSDAAFGVRFADGSGQFLCFFVDGCEVIGNIHDNPELLNV